MSTPTCTKTEGFEAYTVRARGEWATILFRGWQATGNDGQPREIGEIMVHSSYGAWAYQWGHLGLPFKRWLPKAERSYVAEKFMGTDAYVFDADASIADLRKSLIEGRWSGDITKADARSIWDWIDDNESELASGERDFVEALYRCSQEADWKYTPPGDRWAEPEPERGARYFLGEPYERPRKRLAPAFASFWKYIWPVFIEHLREEANSRIGVAA